MHRAFAALAAAILAVPSAAGQAATVVTEAELLAAVGEDHPAVVALREAVGEARAEALAAAVLADPDLGMMREDPAGAAEQIDLTLSWQPPRPGRRLAMSAADRGVDAAEARFAADRHALRLALREVYAEWAIATARVELLAGHAERLAALARRERLRAERGEASGLEARRLALAAGAAGSHLALAEAEATAARAAVRGWQPALGEDAVPELPPLPPPAAVLPAGHPRLTALEQDLAAAELQRQVAARILRWPELVAGWQRQELDAGGSVEGALLGVSWPLPLLDRNRAERSLAATREEAAAARLEAARTRLEADRAGGLAACRRLASAAGEARAASAGNDSMVAAAVAGFEHGEAGLTDLLETLRSVIEAETTALDLHAAGLTAHRHLEELAGRSLDLLDPLTLDRSGDTP